MRRPRPLGLLLSLALVSGFAVGILAPPAGAGASGATRTYIVLYKKQALPSDVATTVGKAGGTLVAAYPQIGVAVVRSSASGFAAAIERDSRVDSAAATNGFGIRAPDVSLNGGAAGPPPGPLPNAPAGSDTLSPLQWDMDQIRAPQAHQITGGSPEVVVGDLDTGLDFTHPDLAPNYDPSRSTDCSSGAPQPLLPGNDKNGHGTHTAGTIAAAANGTGIVGVAPNVKIAGIKSSNDDGFFFPEMVVCAFMWAGTHGIDVTNNSYFADPWLFNCKNDPEQRAIWTAERRAIRFAIQHGVVVVASAGNQNQDLSKTNIDTISPDFPPGSEITRRVTNACSVVPVEVPGVIGVSANGNTGDKSFYSNYGVGAISVVAPGGDSLNFIPSPTVPNGRVLSTWPSDLPCSRLVVDPDTGAHYCYLQGTSMAGPHVVGVAALIESRFGPLSPGQVAAMIDSTAESKPCPSPKTVDYPLNPLFGLPEFATCAGGSGYNGFFGHGEVDALNAVTHST